MAGLKVLITGGNGQLASAIKDALTIPSIKEAGHEFIFLARDQFDITDICKIKTHLTLKNYDYIINTAAYTNVDGAETSQDLAELINHTGVRNLVKAVKGNDTRIIHISTDYVFSGKTFKPYKETDTPCPTSFYGVTKLRGEEAVLEGTQDSVIIRTSWLYHNKGINFVRKILSLAKQRSDLEIDKYVFKGLPLEVVSDQIGSPTSANDLAEFIVWGILKDSFVSSNPEIYHYTNSGIASWYDLAKATLSLYNEDSRKSYNSGQEITCEINPTTTEHFPTAAKRPPYSVLSLEKIRRELGVIPPHWMESLREVIQFGQQLL